MLTALLPLAAMVAPAVLEKPLSVSDAKKRAEVAITATGMRSYLTFIASDALQGRDTPSQGLDTAAEFIAFNLRRFGLKPAGDDGTYFQKIPLVRRGYDAEKTTVQFGETTLKLNADFTVSRGSGSIENVATVFSAKSIAPGADVKGKIVLYGPGAGRTEENAAISAGAVAVIRVSVSEQAQWRDRQAQMARFRGGFSPERQPETAGAPSVPVIELSPEASAKVLATVNPDNDALQTLAKSPVVSVVAKVDRVFSQNIVAIAEGSDPVLKNEYVAIGAHYDHVGTNPNGSGDTIFNGADDDGSGTTGVLAVAQALSEGRRPARSIILVWHCGEEKGLWGSDWFTTKPTVDIKSIVAQLNMDMIGRSKKDGDTKPSNKTLTSPNSIYVIGTTMMSSQLGQIVQQTNKDYLKLTYDPQYDSPDDPNRFFFRSDHYNYARRGIPICFWFDGEHEDYHKVGDEVSKIDFQKMEKIVRTVFVTAVSVANLPARPVVDKPLNR